MEILSSLAQGFTVELTPFNLLMGFTGAFVGTVVGVLPGIGPVNGVAILIPLAFTLGLPPSSALILLASVYYGSMYGGRITSILLSIPGDETAVLTLVNGYPLAQQGKAPQALAISAVASFLGGTLATLGLTLLAPTLAQLAIHFGPAEYFAVFVPALSTLGGLAGQNPIKTLLAGVLGLLLSTVGLDPGVGLPRFTLGLYTLYDGIDFIVALVGLFAISEFLVFLESPEAMQTARPTAARMGLGSLSVCELICSLPAMLRGTAIRFVAGVLPGAGASLGSLMTYTTEKRISNREETFGRGDPRGVAAPEAGNNAAAGGALVSMLALGIPGSGTTAVLLALLISLNIQPGPLLLQQQPDLLWGLIAALYIGNVVLLILNMPLVGLFTRILQVPSWILMPAVVMISFLGVYSINHSVFDLLLMVGFGVLGYLLRKLEVPLVPMVLGLILGQLMEVNLRRALSISYGDWGVLISSPLSIGLWAAALGRLGYSVFRVLTQRNSRLLQGATVAGVGGEREGRGGDPPPTAHQIPGRHTGGTRMLWRCSASQAFRHRFAGAKRFQAAYPPSGQGHLSR